MKQYKCSMSKKKESIAKKSEGLSEYIHYTNPDNGRTASLDPIKHPGLNKFIVYFGAGEKLYSSIKDAEDDLKSRGYEKDESKKSESKKNEDYELDTYSGGQPEIWLYDDELTINANSKLYGFDNLKLKPGETILNINDSDELDDLLSGELDGVVELVDWVQGEDSMGNVHSYPLVKVLNFKTEFKKPESKKSEGATGIGDTMYASKLKSLARKLGSFGFKVSDTVEVKDENANDKSAEYNLSAEKDGKSYKINVDIYEGKHTTITLRDGATNAYISHLGEGSSFASAVSVIDADSVKSESKKSEGISDMIDAKIDYNMFMRMCKTAAYLEEDEDYWDALWDFYSEVGSIGDALVFFDNLFQYTAWKDVDETYDELAESDQDGSKSKEECIEAVLDRDGEIRGSLVRNYGDHYLWVY